MLIRMIRICVKNRWFPLQADAFRGHGLSLLVHFAHCGVSRLMGLHYRSSHRRPFAIPAGVAAFHSNQRGSASR